jgi:hypothetical protein
MVEGVQDAMLYHVNANPTDDFTLPSYVLAYTEFSSRKSPTILYEELLQIKREDYPIYFKTLSDS